MLAAILATALRPRRSGRGLESAEHAAERAAVDRVIASLAGLAPVTRQSDRLGVEAAEFRHLGEQARRGDARQARDRGHDLGPAGQYHVFGQPLGDFGIDGGQMPVNLGQPRLALLPQQPMSKVLLAVPCGSPVRDQRVARHLQFLERALRGRRRLGRPQMQRCPHLRQHPRVYGVGLGALSHRLRKTPRLQRIGARQRQARLQERLLEGAVPRSGGLVHDRADRLVECSGAFCHGLLTPVRQSSAAGRFAI